MEPMYFDDEYLRLQAGHYPVECLECGWTGMENERFFHCPDCGGSSVEEVDLPPILRQPNCELKPATSLRSVQALSGAEGAERGRGAPVRLYVAAVVGLAAALWRLLR